MDQVNIELKNIFKRHLVPIRPKSIKCKEYTEIED